MSSLLPSTETGYLKLMEARVDDPPPALGAVSQGSVVLIFEHTEDPQIRAMASLPIEKTYVEWPVEVFLRFNSMYPESDAHVDAVRAFAKVQEFIHGPT